MKLTNEEEMSCWAYIECYNGNNTKEIRKLIVNDEIICWYCKHIEDIEEMWSKIKDRHWAHWYCEFIQDRPELRKYIK